MKLAILIAALTMLAACSPQSAPSSPPTDRAHEPGFSAFCAANPGKGTCP